MRKATKNILIGTGVTVAGLAAVSAISYLITDKMVKMALHRGETLPTKNKDKISGGGDVSEVAQAGKRGYEYLENCGSKTVEIIADDGVKLVGHWFYNENAKRTVVAMHGWRSSWKNDFSLISRFLHESGCNVLYAEQRAQGLSGGEYMGFGMLERYDCLSWVRFVNKITDSKLPVYLAGISMGATTVLMATGLDLPDNVKGILADCGFTSADAIWKHIATNNLHINYSVHGKIANEICKKKIQIGSKDYSAQMALAVGKTPVLFVHGTDDNFVPIEMTYENYKACTAPKHLLIVPGAQHGLSYFVDKQAYETKVKEFFKLYD